MSEVTSRGQLDPSPRHGHRVERFAADAGHAAVVRHYWVAQWDLPDGVVVEQPILTYPTCNAVVEPHRAALHPPAVGLDVERLQGSGWAVAALLRPSAGGLLVGAPLSGLRGHPLPLAVLAGGSEATEHVGGAMARGDRLAAVEALAAWLGPLAAQLDEEGELVNAIADLVETEPGLLRVADLAERFATTERSLERLLSRRLGVSPKWLVRRRRLQDAAAVLRDGADDLSALAAELGYSDYSHFSRDFAGVVGMTPAAYRRRLTDGS